MQESFSQPLGPHDRTKIVSLTEFLDDNAKNKLGKQDTQHTLPLKTSCVEAASSDSQSAMFPRFSCSSQHKQSQVSSQHSMTSFSQGCGVHKTINHPSYSQDPMSNANPTSTSLSKPIKSSKSSILMNGLFPKISPPKTVGKATFPLKRPGNNSSSQRFTQDSVSASINNVHLQRMTEQLDHIESLHANELQTLSQISCSTENSSTSQKEANAELQLIVKSQKQMTELVKEMISATKSIATSLEAQQKQNADIIIQSSKAAAQVAQNTAVDNQQQCEENKKLIAQQIKTLLQIEMEKKSAAAVEKKNNEGIIPTSPVTSVESSSSTTGSRNNSPRIVTNLRRRKNHHRTIVTRKETRDLFGFAENTSESRSFATRRNRQKSYATQPSVGLNRHHHHLNPAAASSQFGEMEAQALIAKARLKKRRKQQLKAKKGKVM